MNERKKVYKWWWVWDFEKEEQWLNEMASQGWTLEKVGFCVYHFVKTEPDAYVIRLEMNNHDAEYQSFMEELEAEKIGQVAAWSYYRRKAELGEFKIFSTIDSKIEHLQRIARLLIIVGILNIGIGTMNCIHASSMGVINLLCGCLLMYGLGRIHGKEEDLKQERLLHE